MKAEHLSVNAVLGLITVLPPCDNVNAGGKIKVTAKTLKKGGFKIDADAVPDYDLEIMLDGENRVTGEPVKLHIPSTVVAADSELDWFKDDFNEVSFTGNPVLVAGYESSYSVKVLPDGTKLNGASIDYADGHIVIPDAKTAGIPIRITLKTGAPPCVPL